MKAMMKNLNPADWFIRARALAARLLLFVLVSITILVDRIGRVRRAVHPAKKLSARIVMIGTFHNPGWFRAHLEPLARCERIEQIIVVSDEPIEVEGSPVIFRCPDPMLVAILGRSLARLITVVLAGRKFRPCIFMGYHIMPNAPFALIGARLFGAKAIYQMTGGPVQVADGGFLSENPLLRATQGPSRLQEWLMFSLVRCFDAVIVRGSRAMEYVNRMKLAKNCFVITGAIDTERFVASDDAKVFDMVYVGRLVVGKGIEKFLEVVDATIKQYPELSVAIAGEGPLREVMERTAGKVGKSGAIQFLGKIDDVSAVLQASRIFVLLSITEGMSIAMLEAMACGVPVVVTDVGELGDIVRGRSCGMLVEKFHPAEVSNMIVELLKNTEMRRCYSSNARRAIIDLCSVEAMVKRWDCELSKIMNESTSGRASRKRLV